MTSSAQLAYRFNGFRVDPVRRLLFGADGEPIPLKPKVFDTLLYLVERPGELVDKQALLEAVWPHVVVEENNLNKAISTLRQVFGETRDEHRFIVTEPGRGYRFVASVEAVPAVTTEPSSARADAAVHHHSIADVRIEVEKALGDPQGVTHEAEGAVTGHKRLRVVRLAGAVGVTAVVAGGVAGWFLRPVPAPDRGPVARFSVPLPTEQSFTLGPTSIIAVSPDGTRIAYVANRQIFVRDISDREASPVAGTLETTGVTAAAPAFSPDGQWLAYIHVMGIAGPYLLKRVPIGGGEPVTIHDAEGGLNLQHELTWPTADTILFANAEGVVRISANGGETEVLVTRGDDERLYSPQLLPGGKAVLFTRAPGPPGTLGGLEAAQVVVQSIGGNDRTIIWDGGSAARYLPSGHLVYAQGTALFAIPFDPSTHATRGGPVPMVEGLRRSPGDRSDTANFAVSDSGTLVTIPDGPNAGGNAPAETTLAWVDREGREEPFPVVRPDDYTAARISPDGTKIALVVGFALRRARTPAIWIFDRRTGNLSQLTADPAGDDGPVWSSDGSRIFFRSLRGGMGSVYAIELDSGVTTLVGRSSPDYTFPMPWTISPDDRVLGLVNLIDNFDVATLSLADGEFAQLLHTKAPENEPSISPDGAWIAYAGGGPANSEIDIRPFPAVSRTRIPVGPGNSPVFSRDGSELFFFDGSGLSVAPITYEPTLRVGTPRRLFESAAYLWGAQGRAWDADPSGERFLMIRVPGTRGGARQSEQINVVLNWFEELKNRVPVQ